MVETNLIVIEGDWNDGDILREVIFMNDKELEVFIQKFKEIGELYATYQKDLDFRDYGDFLDWLEEYGEDEVENVDEYIDIIENYFPYEGNSQTGCKYINLNYGKIMIDFNNFNNIKI